MRVTAGSAANPAPDEEALLDAAIPDLDWTAVPPGAERAWIDAPS